MKFKIFTKSRSNSRIHTPRLIEEGFFDIYKNELFKNQIITFNAVIESDQDDLQVESENESEKDIYINSDLEESSQDLSNRISELKVVECTDNDNDSSSENELINHSKNNLENSDFFNYKDLLEKMDSDTKTNTIKVSEEDEIDHLRNSIFKKLNILENELTQIKNQNNHHKFHTNSIEINVKNILSNIGKHFVQGVNNIIETGHSTIFTKYSIEPNDMINILHEYNNYNNINLEEFNNKSQYNTPIKGLGFWLDQGMYDKMDDRWFISKLSSGTFFGILDSYNGDLITSQVENLIVSEFDTNLDNEICLDKNNVAKVFLKTILSIDKKILTNSINETLNVGSGLISCFIFFSKADNQYVLFSCNLGNCKGFLSRNNEILKFQNEDLLLNKNLLSENENISNSALGFGFYKPPFKNYFEIDNVPQVISIDLFSDSDRFIVIATDSIWQVFKEEELNEMITNILNEIYEKYPKVNKQIISTILSHSIITESLLRGVTENQICMIALLN